MLNGLLLFFDDFARLPPAVQYAFVVAFGLVIGSFVTVVVHRLPIMLERDWQATVETYLDEAQNHRAPDAVPARTAAPHGSSYNLMRPGSRCDACGHGLRAWENIPVLSYLVLRGRCSACHAPISARYPLIELSTGLIAALAWWRFGPGMLAVAAFAFGAVSLTLACIDWDTRLLPDSITLPFLWAGLLVNLNPTFAMLGDAVIGAAAGYLFLWAIYWGFWWLRGIEGIGLGDLKLFAAIGAWLGWGALVQVLVLASLGGAIVGVALLATRRLRRDEPLPFGPFLAIAACVTLFVGTPLWPMMSLHGLGGLGG
ncbi:prepilin peptidase [Pararobbsia silviterrae]|uniref:Prepilin leader peptidase/N-methyltransferase n=1 Tax=Pararobbsia silviterrae TaxID=1792498 RepID=A0A494XCN7_9BURK|nr:A24 family peptidase [Pararobbsia silviterrae]RKP48525.1 prepilin peptidase [Pararobbsia silviterrae]